MNPPGARPLLVVAAGGLAREALAAVRAAGGHRVVGLLDDDPRRRGELVDGVPVLGPLETVGDHPEADVVIAAGRGAVRRLLVERLSEFGVRPEHYGSVVHPRADLAGARLGRGVIALSGAVATTDVLTGDHVVLMPHVTLTHDVTLGSFATLCAGVMLGGGVDVGEGAYVGMSASVRENVRIGPGAVVGMGAVVLDDVPAGETWAGVPARALRTAPDLRAVR